MKGWFAWALRAACVATQGCADEVNATGESSAHGLGTAQPPACISEGVDPGSTLAPPRRLLVGATLVGQARADREDVYLLDTAEYAGALLSVDIERLEGRGELDVSVTACSHGIRFPSQAPPGVVQRNISFVATGETYLLSLKLLTGLPAESSGESAYAASVQRLSRSSGPCCSSGEGPGCAEDDVLTCLCQIDNACCHDRYDATCLAEARGSCGLSCGPVSPVNDCCTSSATGGCSASDVAECVCAIDPYCCVGGFDESCVNLASHRCGVSCPIPSEALP